MVIRTYFHNTIRNLITRLVPGRGANCWVTDIVMFTVLGRSSGEDGVFAFLQFDGFSFVCVDHLLNCSESLYECQETKVSELLIRKTIYCIEI